jgi:hypothetical protein
MGPGAGRQVLVPFDARESMTLGAAAKHSRKSTNTIRAWAERYGIGRKIGGAWHISRVALQIFLDGDAAALAAYHAGDLTDPRVRSYFERVGCAVLLQKSQNYLAREPSSCPAASEYDEYGIS